MKDGVFAVWQVFCYVQSSEIWPMKCILLIVLIVNEFTIVETVAVYNYNNDVIIIV